MSDSARLLIFGLAGLALLAPRAGAAQAPDELDAGNYELRAGGEVIGTETFAVRPRGQAIRAAGRISLNGGPESPFTSGELWLRTDNDFRPEVVRVQPGRGEASRIVGTRDADRFRLQRTLEAGDRWKEFLAPPELVVLEPMIAHHYFLLFRHLDEPGAERGETRVPALFPSRGERVLLTVSRRGERTLSLNDREVPAVEFAVAWNGETVHAWLDDEGRVLRIADPDGAWSATRTGYGE